jgi:hypothetical protein
METFLDTYDHPKLNQEDINHLERSITQNEIEAAMKSLHKNKQTTKKILYRTLRILCSIISDLQRRNNTNSP